MSAPALAVAFACWIGYGWLVARFLRRRRRAAGSRVNGALLAAVMMVGSAALLLGGLYCVLRIHGAWTFPAVVVVGCVFIGGQMLAAEQVFRLVFEHRG